MRESPARRTQNLEGTGRHAVAALWPRRRKDAKDEEENLVAQTLLSVICCESRLPSADLSAIRRVSSGELTATKNQFDDLL